MAPEYPEVQYFDVDLTKDNQGLGITIAGYVGRDNTPGKQNCHLMICLGHMKLPGSLQALCRPSDVGYLGDSCELDIICNICIVTNTFIFQY